MVGFIISLPGRAFTRRDDPVNTSLKRFKAMETSGKGLEFPQALHQEIHRWHSCFPSEGSNQIGYQKNQNTCSKSAKNRALVYPFLLMV